MTTEGGGQFDRHTHASAVSRRRAPEVLCEHCPSKERGSRECRVHAAPEVSCARLCERTAHEHTGSAEALRHSLRNGFTAYAVLTPATNSSCHRHRRIKACPSPVGPTRLRQFDTSNGCQAHTVLPYAATSLGHQGCRRALAPSSCGGDIAHGINPPCATSLTPTLPRPPHPVPTFVTMANAPLCGDEMAQVIVLICPTG